MSEILTDCCDCECHGVEPLVQGVDPDPIASKFEIALGDQDWAALAAMVSYYRAQAAGLEGELDQVTERAEELAAQNEALTVRLEAVQEELTIAQCMLDNCICQDEVDCDCDEHCDDCPCDCHTED